MKLETNPAFAPPSGAAGMSPPKEAGGMKPAAPPATALGPFAKTRYRFTTGVRAGEIVHVRGDNDEVLLTYRSFASIVGIVAALVSAIVAAAGIAAVVVLVVDKEPVRAAAALVLTIVFIIFISLLAPRTNVTLYDNGHPALTISQRGAFPSATYIVAAPNGAHLGELRRSFLARLGRNRWTILLDGRYLGEAMEDSWSGALLRKLAGKFSRRFQTDVHIHVGGLDVGRIVRRPDAQGRTDALELTNDALDRRVAVALATLVLGREP